LPDIRGSKSEPFFVCGIKIDAIFGSGISAVALKLMPFLITSSLIPSRLSYLARVIFIKNFLSTYFQWEVKKLRGFSKKFPFT